MRRLALVAALAAVVLTHALPASATVRVRGVAVAGYPRVSVTVSTDDPASLSPANVRVVENGVEVRVETVTLLAAEADRIDAVLAIDVSNSMRGPELATALAAAEAFVQQAALSIDVGVLAFAQEPTLVAPLGNEPEHVVQAVAAMRATTSAGTALFDAVVSASEMFDGTGQHNLVLLTDGRNTSGEADLAAAIAAARSSGVTVFAFGLEGGKPNEATLSELATSTGGAYRPLSPEDLGAAYRSLAAQLGQQYVVTFRSKTPPGAQATVVVSLPDGSARTSVLMPPPVVRSGPDRSVFLGDLLDGDLGTVVVVALAFLAAVNAMVLVRTLLLARRRRRELEGRLATGGAPPDGPQDEAVAWVPRPLAQAAEWGAEVAHAAGPVARLIERTGWKIHVGDFLVPAVLGPLMLAGGVGLVLGPLEGVVGAVLLLAVPFQVLAHAGRKRIDAMQGQLPDVLMVLASSLRAGHSFMQALDSVAKEVDDPAGSEFARTLAEIQLGRNVEGALEALAGRVQSKDLDWAVTAINIQRKVGGNLAEVLETVANTIRQREQIRRQIRVLSAEGRISVYILTILPFFVLAYLSFVNPGYLEPLTQTPTGIMLLLGAGVLMVIGYVWMRRIVRLDV